MKWTTVKVGGSPTNGLVLKLFHEISIFFIDLFSDLAHGTNFLNSNFQTFLKASLEGVGLWCWMFDFFVRVFMWFACAYMDKMLSSQWTHGMMVMKTLNEQHLKLCLHEQTCAWDVASCLIVICWIIYQLFKHQTAVPPNISSHACVGKSDRIDSAKVMPSQTPIALSFILVLFWNLVVFFLLLKCLDGKHPHQTLLSINDLLLTRGYHVISQVACYRWKWFFSYRDASKVATAGGPLWPCC